MLQVICYDLYAAGSCWDLYNANNRLNGAYIIAMNKDGSLMIPVYCDMATDGGGWLVCWL